MNDYLTANGARFQRRTVWLARLERWTEWPLTILALALVPVLLAPHFFSLSLETSANLVAVDYLIWGILRRTSR